MNEDIKFKSTLKEPVSDQSKKFEKDFKKTMTQYNPTTKLNETDTLLSEVEQSLKKKIFSLGKMESLVFADPKLTAVYNQMAENGEEKYGYHYNETIQNMIFNDYVLNSPKYLQKYKMAIPKEKKRRDKSGINQLKKAGEITMAKTNPTPKPIVTENDELPTKVMFLVNDRDQKNADVFAYFPEENYDNAGKYKTAYSHIGQHSSASPEYAAESRPASPEEYADLKAELESIGYNLDVVNGIEETTGAGSAGAFAPAMGIQKRSFAEEEIEESTSASSAGGAAGYVGYAGPAAWGSGDLLKKGETSPTLKKPIWKGGTVIQESNYLIDPSGFEKYIHLLNEVDISYQTKLEKKSPNRQEKDNTIINKTSAFTSDVVKNWNDDDTNLEMNQLKTGNPDKPNFNTMEEEKNLNEKSKSKTQQRFMGMVHAVQKGKLSPDKVGNSVEKAAVNMSDKDAEDFASTKHKGLPEKIDENLDAKYSPDENYKFVVESKYIIGFQGREDILYFKTESVALKFVNEKPKTRKYLGIYNIKDDTLTMIQNNGNPDKSNLRTMDEILSVHDTVEYISDRNGENPFELQGSKWQFVNAKYPDGKIDIGVYKFGQDLVFDYTRWREEMGLDKNNNIKEDTQTMIQNNGTSMSNKAQPTGEQPSGMGMGMQTSGGLQESDQISNPVKWVQAQKDAEGMNEHYKKLLKEINSELEAFSIHQNKLMKMSEDRKPSSLVLKDRLGDDNKKNFKSDLQQSGTKEVIDVEKELQYNDQQTDVGDNPQKLGQDIENKLLLNTKGDALLNVGDSDNDKGDEIPKRNFTTEEQHEVDMMRQGQQDLIFDNKPSKRFEDRMKADMGDAMYKIRQEKMKYKAKAPMYNKEEQPIADTAVNKVQFDKEKSGWNEREGLAETMITGRFIDLLGKKYVKDFRLNEAKELKTSTGTANQTGLFELDFTGFGNKYKGKTENKKVLINEGIEAVLSENKFYTDGINVFVLKNPVQKLNENEHKFEKQPINEQVNKMKHLLGYKPNEFVNTTNVKKNRGF